MVGFGVGVGRQTRACLSGWHGVCVCVCMCVCVSRPTSKFKSLTSRLFPSGVTTLSDDSCMTAPSCRPDTTRLDSGDTGMVGEAARYSIFTPVYDTHTHAHTHTHTHVLAQVIQGWKERQLGSILSHLRDTHTHTHTHTGLRTGYAEQNKATRIWA